MSNDIVPQNKQLSLFDALRAVEPDVKFGDNIRQIEIDGEPYFSVLDVFKFSGEKANPAQAWNDTKKRMTKQGFDSYPQNGELRMHKFEGERQRETPIATFKMFLRIAQATDFKEWESIRMWMAAAAHERIEEMITPELGVSRATQRYINIKVAQGMTKDDAKQLLVDREASKHEYKVLMDAVASVCVGTPQYGRIVNEEYLGLFGKIKTELEVILKTKSIRDALPPIQLQHLRTAEISLKAVLEMRGKLSSDEIVKQARITCVALGAHLEVLCNTLGIDRITGQKLLK